MGVHTRDEKKQLSLVERLSSFRGLTTILIGMNAGRLFKCHSFIHTRSYN